MSSNLSILPQTRRGVWPLVLFTLALWGVPQAVHASGITLAKYGGIHGHPNADGGLAVFWNPSRLSLHEGLFLSLDATGIRRAASYDRGDAFEDLRRYYRSEDPTRLEEYMTDPQVREDYLAANTGRGTTSTMAVLPYFGVGYGLSLHDNFRVGVGFGLFPAFGGGGSWDKNPSAPSSIPGALDGPQRWASIASNLLVLHYTGALSLSLPEYGLSLGFSAAYVSAELETTRARNANRSDALYSPSGQLEEGRIHFRGDDSTVAFSVSASLDVANMRASAVYRFRHQVTLRGPLDIAFSVSEPRRTNAFVEFPFPDVFLTSLSGEFGRLTLTGITDFTQWSVIVNNDVKTETPEGDVERLLVIPRNLQNTFSVRGLAEWRFSDRIEAGLMLGYDPSAVPENTLDPGLSDANKVQVGIGARWGLTENLQLNTSFAHDFFTVGRSRSSLHEPSLIGTYRDVRSYLNISLDARF